MCQGGSDQEFLSVVCFQTLGKCTFVLNTNRCKKMFLGIQDCGRYICLCDMVCVTTHTPDFSCTLYTDCILMHHIITGASWAISRLYTTLPTFLDQ